jgi:hypothetical protein
MGNHYTVDKADFAKLLTLIKKFLNKFSIEKEIQKSY